MQIVCKTAVTNPLLATIFKPSLSFVKETRFYSDIIPAFQQFEQISNLPKAERLDVFIRCLGSRISLNPGKLLNFFVVFQEGIEFSSNPSNISDAENADVDAVLLLENVKLQNYFNANRYIGIDVQEAYVVLKVI